MAIDNVMPDQSVLADIRREIEAHEAARAAARRKVMRRAPLFIAVLAVSLYVLARLFNGFADPAEQWSSTPHVFLYVLGVILTLLIWLWTARPVRWKQQDLRDRLFPLIFRFIDDFRYVRGEQPASFDRLPAEMVADLRRPLFGDVISGAYRGFAFEIFELQAQGNGTDGQGFRGAGLAFEAEHPYAGTLLARRQMQAATGFLGKLFARRELTKIETGAKDLDEVYDFRTDNPAAANPSTVGQLASALKWLGETWPSGKPMIALKGGDAFLLLPIEKDYFELPANSAPIDYESHVRPMIADLVALLETAALIRKVGSPSA